MSAGHSLRLLAYAVAVAEEKSVSAAARRVGVSQPTLSRQLRELEQRLGVDLFVRSGRGVSLTPPGEALVNRAARLLADADLLVDAVRDAEQGVTGRLSVAFTGSAINGALGRALARFRRELPGVELRLTETFDDVETSRQVLDGTCDVAVQRLPLRDPRLHIVPWSRDSLSLFMPARHALARMGDPLALSALGRIPLVVWPREASPRAYDEVMALCQRAGVAPEIAAQARTVQTMLALVAAGFGGAVMTSSYRVMRREGVVVRALTDTVTTLFLVSRSDAANPVLEQFRRVLHVAAPGSATAR